MNYRITHDRKDCIACGSCAAISKNWTLDKKDGLANCKKTMINEKEYAENKEAADVCPIGIIHIEKIG